jgi:hypothetical protein
MIPLDSTHQAEMSKQYPTLLAHIPGNSWNLHDEQGVDSSPHPYHGVHLERELEVASCQRESSGCKDKEVEGG